MVQFLGRATKMWVRLKACLRCRGDLAFIVDIDGPYWGCLQCGHHYMPAVPRTPNQTDQPNRKVIPRQRRERSNNARITAQVGIDQRWLKRNHKVVEYLQMGLTTRQIAVLVSRNEREIREIRERVEETRRVAPD